MLLHQCMLDSKFGALTKSQAGLASCLEPCKNITCKCSKSNGYRATKYQCMLDCMSAACMLAVLASCTS